MKQMWRWNHHRVRSIPPWRFDLLLAVLLTGLSQLELWTAERVEGSMLVQAPSFALITASVTWRRSAPLVAAVLASVGLSIQELFGGPAPVASPFVAFLIVTYSGARHSNQKRAIACAVVISLGLLAFPIANPEDRNLPDFIGNFAIFAAIWGLGRAVRSRQHKAEKLEDRAVVLERGRQEQLRATIAEERARIARELHDIIAHSVSVMVLQTGAARQVLETDPQRATQPLLAVEETGRQALDEMHRLLGILRQSDEGLSLAPPASLQQLDTLAEQIRGAGVAVEIIIDGEQRRLSPGMELSAYRIVQEALTNTLKHANAHKARVLIRYTDNALELVITDDGKAETEALSTGGHGLVGMRERVALFGGTLEAGANGHGGWVVHARLPAGGSAT